MLVKRLTWVAASQIQDSCFQAALLLMLLFSTYTVGMTQFMELTFANCFHFFPLCIGFLSLKEIHTSYPRGDTSGLVQEPPTHPMTSAALRFPRPSPSILNTVSNQKLDVRRPASMEVKLNCSHHLCLDFFNSYFLFANLQCQLLILNIS